MTDEDNKKKIVSEPPPPTDHIDDEWGADAAKASRDVPESVSSFEPAKASDEVGKTAVAPISNPVEDRDDEEDEEDDLDEDEEDDLDEDEEDDQDEEDDRHATPASRSDAGGDWLPDWAPFAVLGALVLLSIFFGLGLGSGDAADTEEDAGAQAEAASAPAPAGSALGRKVTPAQMQKANPHQ
jgi:hypothetical protein